MKLKNLTIHSILSSLVLVCISVILSNPVAAQPKPIEIQVVGLADTNIYLAMYMGDKLYYNDTTRVDIYGKGSFVGKAYDDGGKYAVVLPGPKLFDIIVTEEGVKIKTEITDPLVNLEVLESKENEIFYGYVKYINDRKTERSPFDQVMGDSLANKKQKENALEKIKMLNDKVKSYQKDLVEEHGEMLVGKLINASIEVNVPDAPEEAENAELWKYHYYIEHYWDHFDLQDPRMVHDQSVTRLLKKYLNQVVPQLPDSVCTYATELIEQTRNNKPLFQYLVQNSAHQVESSKIMCMDKAFVCLVDNYFASGQADWLNEEQLKKIIDAANDKRNVLCGNKIPNIILPDTTDENWISLYDIKANYTVILIWESTCGHCKKEMPALLDLYAELKDKGVEFYAIGNDFETKGWKDFVKEKDMSWYNVSDNPEINKSDSAAVLIRKGITTLPSLNFRSTFNIHSTPQIFVLDKDKKVVGKGLGSEQLEDFLKRLLEQDAKKGDEG